MPINIALRNVIAALEMIHVMGKEAGLMDGAIDVLKKTVEALEKNKEGQSHDDHNEQGADV